MRLSLFDHNLYTCPTPSLRSINHIISVLADFIRTAEFCSKCQSGDRQTKLEFFSPPEIEWGTTFGSYCSVIESEDAARDSLASAGAHETD